jgi:hypothetical protein
MVSAILIIGKKQQDIIVVKAEDWVNPSLFIIDAQDPYAND